jgi:UPF0042 nucleotide-binding protein
MKSFEDLGFYGIEHLPPAVLDSAIGALGAAGVTDVAIALDLRGGRNLGDPLAAIDHVITTHGARVLYLDARDDVLVRRFSTTRRRHPLAQAAGSLPDAIAADRHVVSPLRERADVVIDTSSLTHSALKNRIAAAFAREHPMRLAVTFVAFGFKYGLPTDLDLLFDVRFLRNPNYVAELALLTGDDAAVASFIAADASLEPFLDHASDLLAFLLPLYVAEPKSHLTVGVGCTGGRHRSVYVARRLMERFSGDPSLELSFDARDVGNA